MNWRNHIHSDPAVLAGKPVVRGTRLAADFLLELLASGWTREQVWTATRNYRMRR